MHPVHAIETAEQWFHQWGPCGEDQCLRHRDNRRGPDGKKHTYPVRVADVVRGEPELDPLLEPGDIIFVPEGFF